MENSSQLQNSKMIAQTKSSFGKIPFNEGLRLHKLKHINSCSYGASWSKNRNPTSCCMNCSRNCTHPHKHLRSSFWSQRQPLPGCSGYPVRWCSSLQGRGASSVWVVCHFARCKEACGVWATCPCNNGGSKHAHWKEVTALCRHGVPASHRISSLSLTKLRDDLDTTSSNTMQLQWTWIWHPHLQQQTRPNRGYSKLPPLPLLCARPTLEPRPELWEDRRFSSLRPLKL